MYPQTSPSWTRMHRRRSADSLHSLHSAASVSTASIASAASGDVTIEEGIAHSTDVLDDHVPFDYFQQDVLRLIHRLRIPGWSPVALDMAPDLVVDRISGALTNSVYAVKPPSYVKEAVKREYAGRPYHHRLPPNLLLRVYGPQVGLLIDREKELKTVESLTRLNIGPRLLGTFQNGRFEQFLNAKPLTRLDLRNPETSALIARRMRDLHDHVPLAPSEVAAGPGVWLSIDSWQPAAEAQLARLERRTPGTAQRVLHRAEFGELAAGVARLRAYLAAKYPQPALVFCHNDTQYGNILRLDPPKGSPLLRPQNEHRQLVVIDFEYSGPNPRAYDIANHFCEWMGDYHHPSMPHHVWVERYPSAEEQERFVASYVESGSKDFDEAAMAAEAQTLLAAARDWRPAVSAFWALWGIVQAPGDADFELREELLSQHPDYELVASSPGDSAPPLGEPVEEDAFDYVSYSSDKLALFWADLAALGIDIT